MFERRVIKNPWDGKLEPFRIIGNVYFVGTFQASTHMIDTGEGLILIDPGYSASLYLVIDSIHRLGFDPRQIKYIINTHWHGDHTEATAAMADLSGAETLIGREDFEKAKRYFTADITIGEGDTLKLGDTTVCFMETPGHTKGTLSFFFEVRELDKTYRIGMFGGAGANTLVREHFDYDGCREDYRASLHRLKKERVDVFLGNHTWNNNTVGFGKILLETGENKFIDPTLWTRFLDFCEERLDRVIAKDTEANK